MTLFFDFWFFTHFWLFSYRWEHRIVFVLIFRCAEQFYVPNMQEQSKTGKESEINRQTYVIWWLNSRKYRSVWYLLSCKWTSFYRDYHNEVSDWASLFLYESGLVVVFSRFSADFSMIVCCAIANFSNFLLSFCCAISNRVRYSDSSSLVQEMLKRNWINECFWVKGG